MEATKAALVLMKNSHFDMTPQYFLTEACWPCENETIVAVIARTIKRLSTANK